MLRRHRQMTRNVEKAKLSEAHTYFRVDTLFFHRHRHRRLLSLLKYLSFCARGRRTRRIHFNKNVRQRCLRCPKDLQISNGSFTFGQCEADGAQPLRSNVDSSNNNNNTITMTTWNEKSKTKHTCCGNCIGFI